MPKFLIKDVAFNLGSKQIDLKDRYPEATSLIEKTGIPFVYESELNVDDLAVIPLRTLMHRNPEIIIDCLICVSQSSNFILPGLSSFIQHKSGLSPTTFLIDINQGCAGFVQALTVASQCLDQWKNIVILCVDKYRSKLGPNDRSTRAVFSDCASATLITSDVNSPLTITKRKHIFDGSKVDYLNQPLDAFGNAGYLHMDGGKLWGYTRTQVVPLIKEIIENGTKPSTIYMHQASKLVFEGISQQLSEYNCYCPSNFSRYGNTVSSTIPLLIEENLSSINKQTSILAGFGVGINTIILKLECSE